MLYTMLLKKSILFLTLLLVSTTTFSQVSLKKVFLSGKIIDKTTSVPVEFTVITISKSDTKQVLTGGSADANGNFNIELSNGIYDIKFEFPGYKTQEKLNQNISIDTNLGNILLEIESNQIETVVIRGEKTTLEVKLDKKVYNVGQDLMVKGGTVSDVLDNIPSVTVDIDGNVALRGNENVKVLIDGKPSNAINIADALKMLPADAVDKVEVITNPSARYDAEGGGGILNIILKKGKNKGINGSIIVAAGNPKNNSISANINEKTDTYNVFSSLSYTDRNTPGRTLIDQENFDSSKNLISYLEERRTLDRYRKGFNGSFGIDLYLDNSKTATWSHIINYRQDKGENYENVKYYNFDNNKNFVNSRLRNNIDNTNGQSFEYNTNYTKKFKKDGHKLTADASFSLNKDNDFTNIYGNFIETGAFVSDEISNKKDRRNRNLFQLDYVLPIKENTQFEAGFRGSYTNSTSFYEVLEKLTQTSNYTNIPGFTNNFQYIEDITAAYTQFGTKFFDKLSFLAGLRFENTNLNINQLLTNQYTPRNYNNLFPSVFFSYEYNDDLNFTLNYSQRINRPRDRFINPFSSYTSNINLFEGNPYLNPAISDVFDFGVIKKADKSTFTSSVYYNKTKNAFQFIRKERGDFINGLPVIISTPINLAIEERIGFEMALNQTITKKIKINSSVNFYNNKTTGEYRYINSLNNEVIQNFDFSAYTWFAKITSKINLPAKIDWQTNATYNAGQKNAQGKSLGVASINLAFSKDILKDKGTLSLNVSDLLNSRKRISEVNLPLVNSYSESQGRLRQITLSFTYRFNKQKNDKDSKPKMQEQQDNGGEF
jgi:outer membrane receptor for ferrienterochelin and colicins